MTDTFLPVISMLSLWASSGLTFQTITPSSVMFHRVWAGTTVPDRRKEAAMTARNGGNLMRTSLRKTVSHASFRRHDQRRFGMKFVHASGSRVNKTIATEEGKRSA